jgi:hypothetical protein
MRLAHSSESPLSVEKEVVAMPLRTHASRWSPAPVLLVLFLGAGALLFFYWLSGVFFLALLIGLSVVVLMGVGHYFTWGRALSQETNAPGATTSTRWEASQKSLREAPLDGSGMPPGTR